MQVTLQVWLPNVNPVTVWVVAVLFVDAIALTLTAPSMVRLAVNELELPVQVQLKVTEVVLMTALAAGLLSVALTMGLDIAAPNLTQLALLFSIW